MNKINCMIKDFMDERNLSAKEFASLIQGSEDTVKNWLYKNVTPSKEFVKTISEVLGEDYLNMRQLWLDAMLPKEQIFTDERFLLPDDKYKDGVLSELEKLSKEPFTAQEKLLFKYSWVVSRILFKKEASLFIIDMILNNCSNMGKVYLREISGKSEAYLVNNICSFYINDYYSELSGARNATDTYSKCSNIRSAVRLALLDAGTKQLTKDVENREILDNIKRKFKHYCISKLTKEEIKNIVYGLIKYVYENKLHIYLSDELKNNNRLFDSFWVLKQDKEYTVYLNSSEFRRVDLQDLIIENWDKDYKHEESLWLQIKDEYKDEIKLTLKKQATWETIFTDEFLKTLSEDEIEILQKFKDETI